MSSASLPRPRVSVPHESLSTKSLLQNPLPRSASRFSSTLRIFSCASYRFTRLVWLFTREVLLGLMLALMLTEPTFSGLRRTCSLYQTDEPAQTKGFANCVPFDRLVKDKLGECKDFLTWAFPRVVKSHRFMQRETRIAPTPRSNKRNGVLTLISTLSHGNHMKRWETP